MTTTTPEVELEAAYRSGDAARIAAAEAAVDAQPKAAATLLGSALWYAGQGLRVFPLSPGSKIPFKGSNGCLDASSNPDVIRGWWESSPEANVGIATGYRVDVVDIDGPTGQASRVAHWCYDEACRAAGTQPRPPADWTPHCEHPGIFNVVERLALGKVSTPRPGGLHIYVPHVATGNLGGALDGIDYRGLGGYVVAPPSVITDGPHPGAYTWLGAPNFGGLS